jgi:hypothetical protein
MKFMEHNTSAFAILGLAVLLVLSPCKVRNYIQSELGVVQTEASNKSKSAFNPSSCQSLEQTEEAILSSEEVVQQLSFQLVSTPNNFINFKIGSDLKPLLFKTRSNRSTASIPLYILYQNLKVYA